MKPAGFAGELSSWGVEAHRGVLFIDPPVSILDEGQAYAVDVENDDKEFVCVGISDGKHAFVFFDLSDELKSRLENMAITGQNFKDDLHKLNEWWGCNIRPEHVVMDTRLASYVMDSSSQDHGLKSQALRILECKYPGYEEITTAVTYKEKERKSEKLGGKTVRLAAPIVENIEKLQRVPLKQIDKVYAANYNGMDALCTARLGQHYLRVMSSEQWRYLHELEMPVMRVLYKMEARGILVDQELMAEADCLLSQAVNDAMGELQSLIPGVKMNPSSPKQVLGVLQGAGLDVKGTDEKKDLFPHRNNPIVAAVLKYRGLVKLKGTYTGPLLELAKASPDGRVRSTFNQSTITGRLSSSKPINFQNLPAPDDKEDIGWKIRRSFVARPGYKLGVADYSQIDFRVLAHVSQEPVWLAALRDPKGDLHQATAEAATRVNGKELARRPCKTINFASTYGSGPKNIAFELGSSEGEALRLMNDIARALGTFTRWKQRTLREAYLRGGIFTLMGRFIPLPELKSKSFWVREEGERAVVAYQGQGGAAEIMKRAMIAMDREGICLLIQEHDAVVWESPEDRAEQDLRTVVRCMEEALCLSVPLQVEARLAHSWAGAKA